MTKKRGLNNDDKLTGENAKSGSSYQFTLVSEETFQHGIINVLIERRNTNFGPIPRIMVQG